MTPAASSPRDRKLIFASVALFLTAGIIFGGTWLLQTTAFQLLLRRPQPEAGAWHLSVENKSAIISQVGEFRAGWQQWALLHKDEVRAMLRASPNDQQAFQKVYDAIPRFPQKEDAGFTLNDLSRPSVGPGSYTWSHHVERYVESPHQAVDPVAHGRHLKAVSFTQETQQHNFATYHDIALTTSATPSVDCVTLWASGRVTETTHPYVLEPGRRFVESITEREIEAPYDFLTGVLRP